MAAKLKLFSEQETETMLPWDYSARMFRWLEGKDVLDIQRVSDHFSLLTSWGFTRPAVYCHKTKTGYTLTKAGGLKKIYDTSRFFESFAISVDGKGKRVWLTAKEPTRRSADG